jgi:hypothetical protein
MHEPDLPIPDGKTTNILDAVLANLEQMNP